MDVLLANPARLEALTAKQRGWVEEAARDAAVRSAALADKDAQALRVACESGARFAEASDADLTALVAAFAPAYATLQQNPKTKAFIERIRALKASTQAEPALSIPPACTGQAPQQASGSAGTSPPHLNGTYRYTLTKEAARKAGETDLSVLPRTNTWILKDGQFDATGGFTGTYSVEGEPDHLRAHRRPPEHVHVHAGRRGQPQLDPVPPVDPGAAFEIGSHTTWTKIG